MPLATNTGASRSTYRASIAYSQRPPTPGSITSTVAKRGPGRSKESGEWIALGGASDHHDRRFRNSPGELAFAQSPTGTAACRRQPDAADGPRPVRDLRFRHDLAHRQER